MKRFLICLLLILALASSAEAVTRYAVPPGTGGCSNGSTNYNSATNSCGSGSSTVHTNINSAISAMSGGDSLFIRAGSYTQPTVAVPGGTTLTAGAGATLISRFGNEIVTLTPPGTGTSFLYCPAGAQRFIILDGLIWDGVNKSADTGLNGGCDHIRFIRMEIKRHLNSGIFGGVNNEYQQNSIHDNGTRSNAGGSTECTTVGCGTPQDHGMYISGPDNIIEDNEIYNNWGCGIQIHANTAINHRNIVRRNNVHNNGVGQGNGGIVVDSGDDNQVYNNITYGHNGGAGIWLSSALNRTLVYNNTSYNNSGDYQLKIEVSSAANSNARNNILIAGPSGAGSFLDNGTSTTKDYQVCTSGCTGVNTVNSTTSNFVNAGAGDFHLIAGAPAINQGVNLSSIFTTDFANVARPSSGAWEVGAYEFASCPAVPQALVAAYSFDGIESDYSGNGFTATLGSGVTYTTGKYGQGLLMPGTAGVTVADANALDFCNGFTLEGWINPSSVSTDYVFINKNPDSKYFLFPALTGYCGSGGVPVGGYSQGGSSAIACNATPLTTSTWAHLAVTYDGTTVSLYKDGSLLTTQAGGAVIDSTTGTLQFCDSGFGELCPSGTIIDEIRLYNYARSAAQIVTDRDTRIGPSQPTIVLKLASGTVRKFGAGIVRSGGFAP